MESTAKVLSGAPMGKSCDYEMGTPFHLIDMTSGHVIK